MIQTTKVSAPAPMTKEQKIDLLRTKWSERAESFTESANKRMTIQGAQVLHSHLQLESASSVLEIAAGGGIGSIDLLQRLSGKPSGGPKRLVVTDLAPQMVQVAKRNVTQAQEAMGPSAGAIKVEFTEANGEDLSAFATGSFDRYIASLCLMMTPDPDAMLSEARRVLNDNGIAGFSIWGRPEHTGQFTIEGEVGRELGMESGVMESNYALGKDLPALRQHLAKAGFSQVRIWPFQLVSELWDGQAFAEFCEAVHPTPDETLREKRKVLLAQKAKEWLETKGFPIGLEVYLIIAKV